MKYVAIALLILASSAYGLPVFSDNTPVNNSYYGKGVVNFSINITSSSLISNRVYMFVISEDAYQNQEPWDNHTLTCVQYATDNWKCTKSVSFATAGSDTVELFYFSAEDGEGIATYGSDPSPLKFRIDRTGPSISYLTPANNSYVKGLINVSISTTDGVSGVNTSMTRISIDNGAWNSFTEPYSINSNTFANNYSLNIRVNATDNVGNPTVSSLNVIVDNEFPRITILQPTSDEKISGTKILSITVNDSYSGLQQAGVTFVVVGEQVLMNCVGTAFGQSCTYPFDTTSLIDGNFTIVFSASDNTSNINTSSVNVTVKNSVPGIELSPDGYASGTVMVSATIGNPEGTITGVSLKVTGPTSINVSMSCNGGFTLCSYSLDTTQMIEGSYTMLANATNILNNTIFDEANVIFDNTDPNVTVSAPSVVKGFATINSDVIDANHDISAVDFTLLGNQYPMTCLPTDGKLLCYKDFNFSDIDDGVYNATVTAIDRANNFASKIITIAVDKDPPQLSYVTIEPLNPSLLVGVSISAVLTDKGSSIKTVSAKIRFANTNSTINFEYANGIWKQTYYAATSGSYEVDMSAEDMNGNARNFTNAGYFFMGSLSCGDGVCQANENYCLCQKDCTAPKCSGNQVLSCSSGLPQCAVFGSCGDKVCGLGETCNSCAGDCGVCNGGSPSQQQVTQDPPQTTEGGSDIMNMLVNIYNAAGGNLPVIIAIVVIGTISGIIFVMKKKQKVV